MRKHAILIHREQLESYKSLPIFKEQAPEEDPHEEAQN